MLQSKTAKSCNECQIRKVRCEMPTDTNARTCMNCKRRNVPCHFRLRKKRDRKGARISHATTTVREVSTDHGDPQLPPSGDVVPTQRRTTITSATPTRLFVDHLLEDQVPVEKGRSESSLLKAHDQYAGSSNIAIFSDRKIASISNRLGHTKFQDFFGRLIDSTNARLNFDIRSTDNLMTSEALTASPHVGIDITSARAYCTSYFEHVHPLYPFLHRDEFERKALDTRCPQFCQDNAPFSSLYHAVLALGCQRQGGGSFQPGQGTAWNLFQVALGNFSKIIASKETLLHAQAVTAMAIFARNSSCVQIEKSLTTQAARIVQALGINRAMYEGENVDLCQRMYWVVYILEKTQSFICDRDSVLVDSNIGTQVPLIPEAIFEKFDYFRALCRFSRLLSKAQVALFTISATLVPPNLMVITIDDFKLDLERWKDSISEHFRPGSSFVQLGGVGGLLIELKLRLCYYYYSAFIALSRLKLSILTEESSQDRLETEQGLLHASCAIIDLTRYIDVDASTPIWVLLSVPLSATFILFDFVIQNPSHAQTKRNIALLGVASGYFCRLELSSNGCLQLSLLSDLAQIARDYTQDVEARITVAPVEISNPSFAERHTLPCEEETRTQPRLPEFAEESYHLSVQDSPQAFDATNENFYIPNEDTSTFSIGNRFPGGLDLTNFFAADFSDYFDPLVTNIFSEG